MVKKLSRRLVVSAFIFVLLLGSLAHLMYASCQTSKWHFIFQRYYVSAYMPDWLNYDLGLSISYYSNYTGVWTTWHHNGAMKSQGEYLNLVPIGEHLGWWENGALKSSAKYVKGK